MRYPFRKTFHPPALRATRWSALLVTLVYLIAGNLHTCDWGRLADVARKKLRFRR